jgi:hypothetical protein
MRKRWEIESVTEVVGQGRLRWFGHLERKDNDWAKACQKLKADGKRSRTRDKKISRECSVEDLKVIGLREEDAQNRPRRIRDI